MNFAPGALVRARGRSWVVLPESEPEFLVVRPLGGTVQETAGIATTLETVEADSFAIPTEKDLGDYFSCRLLRDACRFGFRSSAGPFRSFGRLAVQPRPYQLVPLLMALKLDPVRLLIADDVGIGKTVEAALIARELLDRGEITRICVLCPPHLAEQWQRELSTKFNLHAELVLSSTARRLERNLRTGQTIFDVHPFVIVSMDFIKAEGRRNEFLRTCPDFVIVDEAHTCATQEGRGARHQRYELLRELAKSATRHVLLVTATPHSGNEGAFRSLLTLLKPEFANLPETLSGPEAADHRRRLAAHLVQRRRQDIEHFLRTDTPFPKRVDRESPYSLSPLYKDLFRKVLDYARETVADQTGGRFQQRVRWWSALSLLRALASSPAAAAATLRQRSLTAEGTSEIDVDDIGRKSVLDVADELDAQAEDATSGADPELDDGDRPVRRRLLGFAKEADALRGKHDTKIQKLTTLVLELLQEGHRPIVFCRFIQTAEYVGDHLRTALGKGVDVTCITSQLAPEEREGRIEAIPAEADQARVLVCTDCLSEGVNLQTRFDAVIHYDLSWNPTRHEQRDGRVDRFGQKNKQVRVVTLFGVDNQIDGIVLDVLLRKHQKIRTELGVSVPMPVDSEQIVQAVFEGLLLRAGRDSEDKQQMVMFEEYFAPQKRQIHDAWENAADREGHSRKTYFKQESIKFEEVSRELEECERAIGSPRDVASFFEQSLVAAGAVIARGTALEFDLTTVPLALREAAGGKKSLRATFDAAAPGKAVYLHRTHPYVESVASQVMNSALDPAVGGLARRAGVIRTNSVESRTVLLLLRLRFQLYTTVLGSERHLLAEDALLCAYRGDPLNPQWLTSAEAEHLLTLKPDANVPPDLARHQLRTYAAPEAIASLQPALARFAEEQGARLLDAHRRVRLAAGGKGRIRIESSPPDVLGLYVFLPKPPTP